MIARIPAADAAAMTITPTLLPKKLPPPAAAAAAPAAPAVAAPAAAADTVTVTPVATIEPTVNEIDVDVPTTTPSALTNSTTYVPGLRPVNTNPPRSSVFVSPATWPVVAFRTRAR